MKKFILLSSLAIVAATTAILLAGRPEPAVSSAAETPNNGSGEAQIGGHFELTDQDGNTVKDADYRGRLMLVFFGFTHCPDICPVSAKNLSDTMGLLGDKANQVAPVFISVDPQRDTPEVMKAYFAHFEHPITGLTGTPQQVKQVASAYKAYYSKAQPEPEAHGHGDAHHEHGDGHSQHGGQDYLVDHSGYIYLMDRDGKYVSHFPYDVSPQELSQALAPHLQ